MIARRPSPQVSDSVLSRDRIRYVIWTHSLNRHFSEPEVIVTRLSLIVASIVTGMLLAAGAAYGVAALAAAPQTPANRNLYNYGAP